jgi:hypothetical protein
MQKSTFEAMAEAAGRGAAIVAGSVSSLLYGLVSVPGAIVHGVRRIVWAAGTAAWNTLCEVGNALCGIVSLDVTTTAKALWAVVDGVWSLIVHVAEAMIGVVSDIAVGGLQGFDAGAAMVASVLGGISGLAAEVVPPVQVIGATFAQSVMPTQTLNPGQAQVQP